MNDQNQDIPSMRWLTRTMRGWYRAWKRLRTTYGDARCYNPRSGETWQYMGSTATHHEFRHRDLIFRGRRTGKVMCYVPTLPDDFEVDLGECDANETHCAGKAHWLEC